jgi:hypothetical protein
MTTTAEEDKEKAFDAILHYVWVGTKKYNVQGFDAFINYNIESLVLLNRTDLDVMGLGLDPQEVLAMAREKAREKLINKIGESAKHSPGSR